MAKKRGKTLHHSRTETGQGLSISTIIIAAVGLIVLVVLVAVFTGQIGKFNIGVEREKTGTTCADAAPRGYGGTWNAAPCETGKDRFPSNSEDIRAHPGQYCCAA